MRPLRARQSQSDFWGRIVPGDSFYLIPITILPFLFHQCLLLSLSSVICLTSSPSSYVGQAYVMSPGFPTLVQASMREDFQCDSGSLVSKFLSWGKLERPLGC